MKGARAEEEYLLMGILSGYIVKSYMSVTVMIGGWSADEYWYSGWLIGGVLRKEEDFMTLRWHLLTKRFYCLWKVAFL